MADYYLATPVPPFNTAIGASFGTFTTRQDVCFSATTFLLPTIQPLAYNAAARKYFGEFVHLNFPDLGEADR